MKKTLLIASAIVATAAAQAVSFTNVIVGAGPLTAGYSQNQTAQSLSWQFNNAIVGDPVDPVRVGGFSIQYDARIQSTDPGPMFGATIGIQLSGLVLGANSKIVFTETAFEIDALGNEIGGPLGSTSVTLTPSSSGFWQGMVTFNRSVTAYRAKKSFSLIAPGNLNDQEFQVAAIGLVNQSPMIVPEPGTMAALGLGAAALLRRRKKK